MERSRFITLSNLIKLGFMIENTIIKMATPTKAVRTDAMPLIDNRRFSGFCFSRILIHSFSFSQTTALSPNWVA